MPSAPSEHLAPVHMLFPALGIITLSPPSSRPNLLTSPLIFPVGFAVSEPVSSRPQNPGPGVVCTHSLLIC